MLAAADRVRVEIFDVTGRRVVTLLDRQLPAGEHGVKWSGLDRNGAPEASGVYFYRVTTESGLSTARKMVLAR